jgi:hypothetical protein
MNRNGYGHEPSIWVDWVEIEGPLQQKGTSPLDEIFSLNSADPKKVPDATRFETLRRLGVNRLSMGVQSFDDEELRFLGRIHTAAEARTAYELARRAGFENINLDFMFGLPDQAAQQLIVPRKGVLELARLMTDADATVRLVIGASHIRAFTNEFIFTSKLVDGKFPDYERVLPRNGDKIVLVGRLAMRGVLSRAAILSNEKYRGVRMTVSDTNLQVVANNPEQEEAEESLMVDYQGAQIEIGFNVGYVLDVLNVLHSDQVKITLSDSNSSALLADGGNGAAQYVIMPMRL